MQGQKPNLLEIDKNLYSFLQSTFTMYAKHISFSQPNLNPNYQLYDDVIRILTDTAYDNDPDEFIQALVCRLWDKDPELANAIDQVRIKRSGQQP